MVWTYTYGIDNTHGIDLNSWYSISTSESHTYKRAEFYPYVGLFFYYVDWFHMYHFFSLLSDELPQNTQNTLWLKRQGDDVNVSLDYIYVVLYFQPPSCSCIKMVSSLHSNCALSAG